MRWRIVVEPRAEADLVDAISYLRATSARAALGFIKDVRTSIKSLQFLPHRGSRACREPGLRKLVQGHYEIYYLVNEHDHTVSIMRIWDSRRNPRAFRVREPQPQVYWAGPRNSCSPM